mmetsp:Transcript_33899/g.93747  ORF Transcript_33899/g.93747 Transcript_33899/m.93747 type:complete len:221 (-) Transcript_33899:239-901(-)
MPLQQSGHVEILPSSVRVHLGGVTADRTLGYSQPRVPSSDEPPNPLEFAPGRQVLTTVQEDVWAKSSPIHLNATSPRDVVHCCQVDNVQRHQPLHTLQRLRVRELVRSPFGGRGHDLKAGIRKTLTEEVLSLLQGVRSKQGRRCKESRPASVLCKYRQCAILISPFGPQATKDHALRARCSEPHLVHPLRVSRIKLAVLWVSLSLLQGPLPVKRKGSSWL